MIDDNWAVKAYDERGLRAAFAHTYIFNPQGEFKLEDGELFFPVKSNLLLSGATHWALKPAEPAHLHAWCETKAGRKLQRRFLKKGLESDDRDRLTDLYETPHNTGVARHFHVLSHPYVEYVQLPLGLCSYWLDAQALASEANAIHLKDVSGGQATRDAFTTVVIAAEELMSAIERLDSKGLELTTEEAPAVHDAFADCLLDLQRHFAALKRSDGEAKQELIAALALEAQANVHTVRSILGAQS